MSELATLDPVAAAEPEQGGPSVHEHEHGEMTVIAKYPYQIAKAQDLLIGWAANKIDATAGELVDAQNNLDVAVEAKLATGPFERAVRAAKQRLEYYRKIKAALDEGYCIVPNFPIDVIAIRTKRSIPRDLASGHAFEASDIIAQEGQVLPAGEGSYVAPTALIEGDRGTITTTNARGEKVEQQKPFYWPTQFKDVVFPFVMAKPEILSATGRALASKIFDQLGVLPARKKEDPMVLGRILDPSTEKAYSRDRGEQKRIVRRRFVTFMVCWWLDTRDL